MAYIDDLKTARNNIAARLKDVTDNPRPTYSLDGESYSWGAYLGELTGALEDLNKKIAAAEPFQVTSYGRS